MTFRKRGFARVVIFCSGLLLNSSLALAQADTNPLAPASHQVGCRPPQVTPIDTISCNRAFSADITRGSECFDRAAITGWKRSHKLVLATPRIVQFSVHSSDFHPDAELFNDRDQAVFSAFGERHVPLRFTRTLAAGTYTLVVYLADPFGRNFATGREYSVTLSCAPAVDPPPPEGECQAGPEVVCLLHDRFEVKVKYRNQYSTPPGTEGFLVGKTLASSATGETAYFWFSDPANAEWMVRVYDARPFDNHYHVFYGGMSDVEFWVQVRDTQKNVSAEYHIEPGTAQGGVDRSTFTP